MERLLFRCPKTGQDIDVGIDSELETLLRIRSSPVRARSAANRTNGEFARHGCSAPLEARNLASASEPA